MLTQSPVLTKILQMLDERGVSYKKFEHEPVYTSAEASKIRETSLSEGAKSLVLFADDRPVLVVVPGDKKLDFRKFKHNTGVKNLRMATLAEISKLTGLEVGAIPPVGKALGLPSYYDNRFKKSSQVVFNAGAHTVSIVMSADSLLELEQPVMVDVVKDAL